MKPKALMDQLREWGVSQIIHELRVAEVLPNPREHIIERSRRFAPMTRKRAAKLLLGRDGEDRRRLVARAAGVQGMTVAPKWSTDPIRCTETRSGGPRATAAIAPTTPDDLRWIDRALAQMTRSHPIRALVVREEFSGRGVTQRQRAKAVAEAYGGAFSVWQYRRELEQALSWLDGRQLAA